MRSDIMNSARALQTFDGAVKATEPGVKLEKVGLLVANSNYDFAPLTTSNKRFGIQPRIETLQHLFFAQLCVACAMLACWAHDDVQLLQQTT